jgi:hypothetical protein
MSLQDIFYLVAIVAMSLLTILFLALVILTFYIKSRINDIFKVLSNPGKIVSSVGNAMVDTAIDQVSKLTNHKKRGNVKKLA